LPTEGQCGFFGEKALVDEGVQEASVRVLSAKAQVLVLDRRSWCRVLQKALDVEEERLDHHGCDLHDHRMISHQDAPASSPQLQFEDLEEVGVLGWGSYAKVTLVKCRKAQGAFALKSVGKGRILQRRQVQQVQMERLVLITTCNRFIIRLVATFRTETHLSFLMEPAMGGDLCTVFERYQLYYSARHARFYVACALQGLEHLHSRWIVMRDLKLENMLLDAHGYCKLADFGLAKFVVGHTFTLCGTPDYMAPEVVTGVGHTRAIDWWALGVVLYGLMAGVLPFDAPKPPQIFAKVKRGIEPVLATTGFGGGGCAWTDVVRLLCKLTPSERLPVRKGGIALFREHSWFTAGDFDWMQLSQGTMPAPYVPIVKGPYDLSNFDPNPEDAPPTVPYYDPGNDWDADFAIG